MAQNSSIEWTTQDFHIEERMKTATKTCEYCSREVGPDDREPYPFGDKGEVLCSSCHSDHFRWCRVCKKYVAGEDWELCRHLFYDDGSNLMGIGSDEAEPEDHKAGFLAVLNKTQLAEPLRLALKHRRLETTYGGPIIGRGWYDCYMPRIGFNPNDPKLKRYPLSWRENYGDHFTEDDDPTEVEQEALSVGVGWLDGLADPKVHTLYPEAVAATLAWIDEWEANRDRHQTIAWFRGTHRYQRKAREDAEVFRAAQALLGPGARFGDRDHLSACGRFVGTGCQPYAVRSRDRQWCWQPESPDVGQISSYHNYDWPRVFGLGFGTFRNGVALERFDVVFDRPIDPSAVSRECAVADFPAPDPACEALRGSGNLTTTFRVGKKAAGRLLDGREWSQFPSPRAAESTARDAAAPAPKTSPPV